VDEVSVTIWMEGRQREGSWRRIANGSRRKLPAIAFVDYVCRKMEGDRNMKLGI
jgi:hypothetical protein